MSSKGNGERSNWTKEHPYLAERMPFTRDPGRSATPSKARILEAVIVAVLSAALTAAATIWGTQMVLEEKLNNLESSLDEIKAEQRRMRSDLYRPRYQDGAWRYSTLYEAWRYRGGDG